MYRCGRHGGQDRIGQRAGCTDTDVHGVPDECAIRCFVATDMVRNQCNQLHRVGWVDWREEYLRNPEHRCSSRQCQLYADVFRSRRFSGTNRVCRGNGGSGTDSDPGGVTGERDLGRIVAIDVVRNQCNELHRFGQLDRRQGYVGEPEHRRSDGERELHPHVFGERRFHCTDGRRCGGRAGADGEPHRVADERAIRLVVAADLEHHECDELRRFRCMDGSQGDIRYAEHRRIDCELQLHVDVCRRGR